MMQQTTNQDENNFHEQTNTFDLTVILTDNKLTINLKDYVNWIIYSKEYTEEDYCKEIHKKMELSDVYDAFVRTQPRCDQENMRVKQKGDLILKEYVFGTMIQDDKLPCYKVEKEGIITVYLNITERNSKKQVTYESKLLLKKMREMTETEISVHKSSKDKNQILDELKKQLEEQKRDKKDLIKRIMSLEQENGKLKAESASIKQQLASKLDEFEIKVNLKNQQQTQRFQQKITQENQQLDQRIIQANQQLANKVQQLQRKFAQLMAMFELQKQRSIENIMKKQEKIVVKPVKIEDVLHEIPQANFKYFSIQKLKLKYISDDKKSTQYMFNIKILPNQQTKFKIKILNKRNYSINIGVVDYTKQKDSRNSSSSGNAMCYQSNNGFKKPESIQEGNGFKQNDVVEVNVDRFIGTVKYFVNGVLRAKQSSQILADAERIFVPFVEIYEKNDAVEWVS